MMVRRKENRKMETLVVIATIAMIATYAGLVYRALPQN